MPHNHRKQISKKIFKTIRQSLDIFLSKAVGKNYSEVEKTEAEGYKANAEARKADAEARKAEAEARKAEKEADSVAINNALTLKRAKTRDKKEILENRKIKAEIDRIEAETKKIKTGDTPNQLNANLQLVEPEKEIDIQKTLYDFAWGVRKIPQLAVLAGYLLFVKVRQEQKTEFAIYNLTGSQLLILDSSPDLLKKPSSLASKLGLIEKQTVAFDEQDILTNPPRDYS
ncbi:hypothetical protein BKI52_32975 [marine bacterium AO1-C]|nr:hypothetical protein BKI52_32975 [marine bacterium AO1-C]